jgi:hypothetical protein
MRHADINSELQMGQFFTAVKRGLEAMGEAPTGERYSVAGRSVSCGHCQHDHFVEGRAQLNTAGMTFLNLDWANRSAATLTCTACGRIEWFLADPEEIG